MVPTAMRPEANLKGSTISLRAQLSWLIVYAVVYTTKWVMRGFNKRA